MERKEHIPRNEPARFAPPARVLEAALAKIQKDGSVLMHDEDEVYFSDPRETVELEKIPADVYQLHLLRVARSIYGTVSHIAIAPTSTDTWLEALALHLSSYRHDLEFLQNAVSLGRINADGSMQPPRLPRIPPSQLHYRR